MVKKLTKAQTCNLNPLDISKFNRACLFPFGLTVLHIKDSMMNFINFLGFVNTQLNSKNMPRLESLL